MHKRIMGSQSCRDLADLRPLLFLYQTEQVDLLLRYVPELLQESQLVAVTLDVRTRLLKINRRCHVPWEYLCLDTLHRIRLDAEKLMREWFLPWNSHSRQGGIDIPFIDHETQKWFFREAIFVRELARTLFSKLECVRHVVISGPLRRPSVYYYDNDTPGAMLAYVAESAGIDVTLLYPPGHSLSGRIRTHLGALKRAFFRSLPETAWPLASNGFSPPNDAGRRPTVGVCIHGLAFHAELVRLLRESGFAVIAVLLSDITRQLRAELRKDATIINLVCKGSSQINSAMQRTADETWSRFAHGRTAYQGQFSEILANPYLDFHFRYYFLERWPRIAAFIQRVDDVLKRLTLDCLITSNLTDTENWALCEVVKRKRIPLIVGLHSGWPDPEALLPRADTVMLWSESQRKHLAHLGSAELSVTGALGYDEQIDPTPSSSGTEPSHVLADLGVPPGRKVILVLTTNVNTGLFPVLDVDKHLATLAELFRVPLDLQGEVHVVAKTKPGFDHPQTYELIRETEALGSPVTISADAPLEEAVAVCDVVLLVNIPTTAYLDAIFRGKPLLFVSTVPIEYCGQPRMPDGGVYTILTASEIWPIVRRVLLEPQFREEILRAQWAFQGIDMPLGQARRRIVEIVESTCQRGIRG